MIFLNLRFSGFLGVRDEQELDFNQITFAAVVGKNGAGKSTMFQAISWALFGKCRISRDADSIINDLSDAAEVSLELQTDDGMQYLVHRYRRRGTASKLRFLRWEESQQDWIQIGSHIIADNEAQIMSIIGMDYSVFTTLVFLEQGSAATSFLQAKPEHRHEIVMQLIPEMQEWFNIDEAMSEHTSQLNRDYQKTSHEIDFLCTRVNELNSQLELMNEDFSNMCQDIGIKGKSPEKEILKKISQVESDIAELEKKADKFLSQKIKAVRAELDDVRQKRLDDVEVFKKREAALNHEVEDRQRATIACDNARYSLESAQERLASLEKPDKGELKEIQEEIADLDKRRQVARDKTSSLSERIARLKADLEVAKDTKVALDIQHDLGEGVCLVCESRLSEKQADNLHRKAIDRYNALSSDIKSLIDELEAAKKASSRLSREIQERNDESRDIEADIADYERSKSKFENMLEAAQERLREWEEARSKTRELDDIMADLDDLKKPQRSTLELDLSDELDELLELQDQDDPELTEKRQNLALLIKQQTSIARSVAATEQVRQSLAEAQTKLDTQSKMFADYESDIDVANWLSKATSSKGVPARIIANVIQQIEDEQNDILASLANPATARIEYRTKREAKTRGASDRQLLDIIALSQDGREKLFEALSEGEKVRVNLSNIVAMIRVFKRYGINSRMMWLDEPFGAIDRDSIPIAVEVLNEAINREDVDMVMLITHEAEVIDLTPQTIRTTTVAGSTRYEVIA